jgi:hypothetical protein
MHFCLMLYSHLLIAAGYHTGRCWRQLVRRGTKISPMRNFFLTVGFPDEIVGRAVADYERQFVQLYRPKAFANVDEMLRA